MSDRLPPSLRQPVDWILAVRPYEPRWTCPMDDNRSSNVNGDNRINGRGSDTPGSIYESSSMNLSWDWEKFARPKINGLQQAELRHRATPGCLSGFSIQVCASIFKPWLPPKPTLVYWQPNLFICQFHMSRCNLYLFLPTEFLLCTFLGAGQV